MKQVHDILEWVNGGEPMTVDELQWAVTALGVRAQSGQWEVLVARLRVAYQLERLTRADPISGAA